MGRSSVLTSLHSILLLMLPKEISASLLPWTLPTPCFLLGLLISTLRKTWPRRTPDFPFQLPNFPHSLGGSNSSLLLAFFQPISKSYWLCLLWKNLKNLLKNAWMHCKQHKERQWEGESTELGTKITVLLCRLLCHIISWNSVFFFQGRGIKLKLKL